MAYSSSSNNPLASCVESLKTSMSLLDSSISILGNSVADFPRLTKVLTATRHFELTSEPLLRLAQADMLAEIQPGVETLLARVETELERMERRREGLVARAELLEGRIGGAPVASKPAVEATTSSSTRMRRETLSGIGLHGRDARLRALKAKRERLEYAVQRLNLQAGQKERQLRMSMAAQ
ncbi:MAG: hypothetical protein M1825_004798 [Sarcosagium campestre]|nr:MAG: hypothetical protein M1825_004798 [Sarcosagium campestre]